MKRHFKVFSRRSGTKFDRCNRSLSWTNIQSSRLTFFSVAGNNYFLLFLNVYNNFLYLLQIPFSLQKNGFATLYQEIVAEAINFLDILFVDANKFSSGASDFFPFSYTQSFCKLTAMSREKYYSSCHNAFSIMRVLRSKFLANAMA